MGHGEADTTTMSNAAEARGQAAIGKRQLEGTQSKDVSKYAATYGLVESMLSAVNAHNWSGLSGLVADNATIKLSPASSNTISKKDFIDHFKNHHRLAGYAHIKSWAGIEERGIVMHVEYGFVTDAESIDHAQVIDDGLIWATSNEDGTKLMSLDMTSSENQATDKSKRLIAEHDKMVQAMNKGDTKAMRDLLAKDCKLSLLPAFNEHPPIRTDVEGFLRVEERAASRRQAMSSKTHFHFAAGNTVQMMLTSWEINKDGTAAMYKFLTKTRYNDEMKIVEDTAVKLASSPSDNILSACDDTLGKGGEGARAAGGK